jgi:hypothetical protein
MLIRVLTHFLQLRALGLLIFARLCCLSVELLCCELLESAFLCTFDSNDTLCGFTLRLKSAFSRPDMIAM